MKHLSLAIFLILSVQLDAETIVGEFSGPAPEARGSSIRLFAEAGVTEGQIIHGSFAYESDALPMTGKEVFGGTGLEDTTYFQADYLRLQFGSVLMENTEVFASTSIAETTLPFDSFAFRDAGTENIPDEPGAPNPLELQMFGDIDLGPPISTHKLPASIDDFDYVPDFHAVLPNGSIIVFPGKSLTLKSQTICDPSSQGDLNGDGRVGFDDFLILSDNFGSEVTSHEYGDIDCDGSVQFADFLALSNSFGKEVRRDVSLVPEPDGFFVHLPFFYLILQFTNRDRLR